ncbi:PTS mannose transporter subunit IIA [Enterococcus cecorum]|nr:PTS mannose transporter subunit IIA [Enterococcus cecorum]
MKKKYLIATHGYFAKGLQSALEILADKGKEITVINAYVDDSDYFPEVESFISSVDEAETAYIFTDLFGGSVNQNVVRILAESQKQNIKLITNTNLAIILSIIFSDKDILTDQEIDELLLESAVRRIHLTTNNDEEAFF